MEDQGSDSADEFKKLGQKDIMEEDQKEQTHNTFRLNSDSDYTPKKSGASKLLLLILVLVVVGLIGGTFYLFKDRLLPSEESKATPAPTPIAMTMPEETPAPTPTALDRSKFKVRVLNGTSTSSLAKEVSDKLKELGYEIDKTGNATNSAFAKTQIRAKSTSVSVIDQLIQDLAPNRAAASSSAGLKEADAADAEVIIGTE